MMASAALGGGTNTTEALAPVATTASSTVRKIGTCSPPSKVSVLACPAGMDRGHHLRAVGDRQLGMESAGLAQTLDQQLGVGVDQDAHRVISTIF